MAHPEEAPTSDYGQRPQPQASCMEPRACAKSEGRHRPSTQAMLGRTRAAPTCRRHGHSGFTQRMKSEPFSTLNQADGTFRDKEGLAFRCRCQAWRMAVAHGKIGARRRRTAVTGSASKNSDLRPKESGGCRTGWIGSQAQRGGWGRGALLLAFEKLALYRHQFLPDPAC